MAMNHSNQANNEVLFEQNNSSCATTCFQSSDDSSPVSSALRPKSPEKMPLVIIQEQHCQNPTIYDDAKCLKKAASKPITKTSTISGDGDHSTHCTVSTEETLDFEFQSFLATDEDGNDFYFETESNNSLEYSMTLHSRSRVGTLESFTSLLSAEKIDESYYTEGFVDVGELPRVY